MSVTVKKTLVPKKNTKSTTNGFYSTVNNINQNINTDNLQVTTLSATQLNASNITATNITANNADITNGYIDNVTSVNINAANANINDLTVSGTSSLADTNISGNLTTYGNVTHNSSATDEFDKTFDIRQVISYFGSYNYFDELIGGEDSTITAHEITTEKLTVTKSAHFFELIIDKVKAAGGTAIFTPADGFEIEIKENVNGRYRLYWRASSEVAEGNVGQTPTESGQTLNEKMTSNMWKTDDQALSQSFNISNAGVYSDVSNTYWWRVVYAVSDAPIIKILPADQQKYYFHWIEVYGTGQGYVDANSDIPAVGDTVAMLGNQTDTTRQSAIVISAYASNYLDKGYTPAQGEVHDTIPVINPPYIAQYVGICDFNLGKYRQNWISKDSTTLQGNIKLSSGKTVTDYVDEKIRDIQSGEQFYTNLLVFSNQNINVPCTANGTPIITSSTPDSSYIYAYHGNTSLNIASVTFNSQSSHMTWDGAHRVYCGDLTSMMTNDVTQVGMTVTAYLSGSSGDTINYNGTLFYNKVKTGETGADGQTPIVYDIVSNASTRIWDNDIDLPSPSSVLFTIRKTDASNTSNPYSIAASIPIGMSLWYRIFNHETGTWLNYSCIDDYSSGWTWTTNDKYSINVYLCIGTNYTFANNTIYDSHSVNLIISGTNGIDGTDGTDGTDGVNGTNIVCVFTNAKATVLKTDTLVTTIQGQLLYREGTGFVSYNFNNFKYNVTNDGTYDSTYCPVTNHLKVTNGSVNSDGSFSWTPSNYAHYHTNNTNYSYRPTTLYFNVKDNSSNTVASTSIPITFEAGAVLEVTDSISASVQDANGRIDNLVLTANGLRNDVDDNAGDISTLQQTASSLTTRITDAEGNISTLEQTTDRINLKLTNTTVTNLIEQDLEDSNWTAATSPSGYTSAIELSNYKVHDSQDISLTFLMNTQYSSSSTLSFQPKYYQNLDNIITSGIIPAGARIYCESWVSYEPNNGQTNIADSSIGMDFTTINLGSTEYIVNEACYFNGTYCNSGGGTGARHYIQINKNNWPSETSSEPGWYKLEGIFYVTKPVSTDNIQFSMYSWHDKNKTVANQPDVFFSEPVVYLDSIGCASLGLSDGLESTGIDIENGTITLNANNTIVNGDLALRGTFDSYDSAKMNEIIIDAEGGSIKMKGADRLRDASTLLPVTGATQIDLAELRFCKDPDTLRAGAELVLYSYSSTLTMDAVGVYWESSGGVTKGKTWAQILS